MICNSKYVDTDYNTIELNLLTLDDCCSIDVIDEHCHSVINLSPEDAIDLANRILKWYKK